MKKYIAIITLFFSFELFPQDYFPLQIGNVWYRDSMPYAVEDTVTINGQHYFKFFNSYDYDYYRKDSTGTVYVLVNDTDRVYFKFNDKIVDAWTIDYSGYTKTMILKSTTDTVRINDITFFNCHRYFVDIEPFVDGDNAIWLAPDVGIVKWHSVDWGDVWYLSKARVNGVRIPSKILSPEITQTRPTANRNDVPVDAHITISFKYELKPEFISKDYFQIFSSKTGMLSYEFVQAPNHDFSARLQPDKQFINGDTLTVTVSKEIKDYMDDHLPEDFTFKFAIEKPFTNPEIFIQDTISHLEIYNYGNDFDLGDDDNDGDKDLIISGSFSLTSRQLRDTRRFENVDGRFIRKSFPVNIETVDFLVDYIKYVDFNKDGYLDVSISGYDNNYNPLTQFYKSEKDSFILCPEMNLPFKGAIMEWNDYNNDSYPDLAIHGISQPRNDNIFIYKNKDGALVQDTILSWGQGLPSIHRWMDLDGNEYIDLVKTGLLYSDTKLYFNYNGTFKYSSSNINYRERTPFRYNLDCSDVDNDGDIDLMISHKLFLLNDGNFELSSDLFDDYESAFIKFFDIDNDGYDDLFMLGDKYDPVDRINTYIQIYKNNYGNFNLEAEYRFGEYISPYKAIWTDINGDNKIDLVATTRNGLLVFYNNLNVTRINNFENKKYNYSLSQNFPNPFNPNTKIKYSIPVETGHSTASGLSLHNVLLKVYDILGKEVATLVNKEQPAGEYEVELSAEGGGRKLTSGIYFYQLTVGSFIETKKMILLK
jgi:hypothetical protein